MANLLTVFGCSFSRSATSRMVRISSSMENFSMLLALIQLMTPPKREITHELDWVMECEIEIDTQPCSAGELWRRTAYFTTAMSCQALSRLLRPLRFRSGPCFTPLREILFYRILLRKGARVWQANPADSTLRRRLQDRQADHARRNVTPRCARRPEYIFPSNRSLHPRSR